MRGVWMRGWVLMGAIAGGVLGCDDDAGAKADGALNDAAVTQDAEADARVSQDQGTDAAPPDAGPGGCVYPADCPGSDCVDGACLDGLAGSCADGCADDEVCGGAATREHCARPCELDRTCARRGWTCTRHQECAMEMSCHDGRCINNCATDLDCPAAGFCYNGECIPEPDGLAGGDPPVDLGDDDGLMAGVAVVPLNYPVGVSMAGYGNRPGPRNPYAYQLGGSDRAFERQDVRVIALVRGAEALILVRIPLSWSSDHMLTLINNKVRALTRSATHPEGLDFTGRIVTMGTHSHSQPGRFWNLAPGSGFGVFGHGLFSPEMVDRYTTSFAEAIKAALDDLSPASAGFTVVDDFDPDRRIHSDRRSANAPNVDDRMMVLRVDDREGNPRAAVVNLAIHGTHMEETWITGDVAGGIEVVATEHLSAIAGHYVPVLFANGNAGDISPRGDDLFAQPWGKIQTVGHRVWPIFEAAFSSIVTEPRPALEVVTTRLPISYDILGYDRSKPEFADRLNVAQIYGGFQCVAAEHTWGEEPPYSDDDLGCLLNLANIIGAPMQDVQKTVISAFRIGQLIVTTLPGEPVSALGQGISARVEQMAHDAGLADARVLQFGYSQDHHLYLLLADDWLQGGYEAGQNLWGWRFGAYISEQSVLLASQLFTPTVEDNRNPIKPTWWPDLVDDTIQPTPTANAAEITLQPPATLRRGAMFSVQWRGGHPGIDLPRFTLEQQQPDDSWAPGHRAGSALPFDDRGFETLLLYHGDFMAEHTWEARVELPFDLPAGTWRLAVDGKALPEGATGFNGENYRAESIAFELTAARLRSWEVGVEADGTARFGLTYPDGPSTDTGEAFETLAPTGHFARLDTSWQGRTLRDGLRGIALAIGPPLPIGAVVEVSVDDAPVQRINTAPVNVTRPFVLSRNAEGTEVVEDRSGVFASEVRVPGLSPGRHVISVSDVFGNFTQFEVEVPAP